MRTSAADHDELLDRAIDARLPAPPKRPVAGECCDRGCDPCVWDYYEQALTRWCERHELVRPPRV